MSKLSANRSEFLFSLFIRFCVFKVWSDFGDAVLGNCRVLENGGDSLQKYFENEDDINSCSLNSIFYVIIDNYLIHIERNMNIYYTRLLPKKKNRWQLDLMLVYQQKTS